MAERLYNGVVTDEGIAQARQAKGNIGWYIIPTKYGISDVKGAFSAARTIDQVNPAWYEHGFNAISDVSYLEKNKLMFTVTIPGNAFTAPKTISEIYFYAQTPQGTEYLYVLIQPINPITWNPGVTQKMSFVIALSNSDKGDIYNIQFSSPDDIEDHNIDLLAHPYLLARDGSRTATGILKYAEKLNFTNPREIPDLEYVLNAMPTGFMTYWPVSTPPSGYLVRNGAAISRTAYPKLHTLFANAGYPYGQGDGVTTFNLPDDRGLFVRGWDGGKGIDPDRIFGSYQEDAINVTALQIYMRSIHHSKHGYGGGRLNSATAAAGTSDELAGALGWSDTGIIRSTKQANETRVKNRAYLPIIKY